MGSAMYTESGAMLLVLVEVVLMSVYVVSVEVEGVVTATNSGSEVLLEIVL
jgi:hypothetical protein